MGLRLRWKQSDPRHKIVRTESSLDIRIAPERSVAAVLFGGSFLCLSGWLWLSWIRTLVEQTVSLRASLFSGLHLAAFSTVVALIAWVMFTTRESLCVDASGVTFVWSRFGYQRRWRFRFDQVGEFHVKEDSGRQRHSDGAILFNTPRGPLRFGSGLDDADLYEILRAICAHRRALCGENWTDFRPPMPREGERTILDLS